MFFTNVQKSNIIAFIKKKIVHWSPISFGFAIFQCFFLPDIVQLSNLGVSGEEIIMFTGSSIGRQLGEERKGGSE